MKANLKSEQEKCSQFESNIKSLEKELDDWKKYRSEMKAEQSKIGTLKADFDQLKKFTEYLKADRNKCKSRL